MLVKRNWLLGKSIAYEELKGESRAEYGQGFDKTNLYYYLDFAKVDPTLFEVYNQTKRIIHTEVTGHFVHMGFSAC